jgi:hypothetical protein
VAGPGRYEIDAERSAGTCESEKKSIQIVKFLPKFSLENYVIFCFHREKGILNITLKL